MGAEHEIAKHSNEIWSNTNVNVNEMSSILCHCIIYGGRTESHEQLFFLYANWVTPTKESAVVDETSCCVILECLVTSIACIT